MKKIVSVLLVLAISIIDMSYKLKFKEIIKRFLNVAFSLLLLISILIPILKVDIKTEFIDVDKATKITTPIYNDIFINFELNEVQKELYEDMYEEEIETYAQEFFSYFENYSKRDVKKGNGEAYNLNKQIFSFVVLCGGAYDYSVCFAIGAIAISFILCISLFIIWQNICDFSTRHSITHVTY